MKYISKKNIRNKRKSFKNIKKPINNIKRIINIYGGKPPIRNEHFIIFKSEDDVDPEFHDAECPICQELLFEPNDDDASNDDDISKWIIQCHPSIQPQAPHLFHYSCIVEAYQHSAIENDVIVRDGKCPNCRVPMSANAVHQIFQEGGIPVSLPHDDDDDDGYDDDDDHYDPAIVWGARAWNDFKRRRVDHRQPNFYPDIGNYLVPPVGESVMESDEPEGCSFIPRMPGPYGFGLTNDKCARTTDEFNDPYKCSVSGSNRCILKKKSHRPVGCKFINQYGRNGCIPTEEGEIDEPDNCMISNYNRCILNPIRKVIPQGCVAVPIVYENQYGPNLTYKCKPTNNAAHNQPQYCEVNALAKCKKKSKTYRRR